MLNSVKAGTQQRTSSPIAKDSAGESFKNVLGKAENQEQDKARSQEDAKSQQRPERAIAQQPKPLARQQASAGRRQSLKQQPTDKNVDIKDSVQDSDKNTVQKKIQSKSDIQDQRQAKSINLDPEMSSNYDAAPVEGEISEDAMLATDVGPDGIPGAPDPSSGMKANPEIGFTVPSMLAMQTPMNNKSKEVYRDSQLDGLTRRAVWSDFLRKMNEELGVDAEQVLAAFSTLNEKELAAPPEQNVDKLVMALGLNPEQTVLAQRMFTDLISKTQSKSLGEELANSTSSINLSLMSQREMQRKQLQSTLDQMNSAFFMSRQGKLATQPVQDQNSKMATDGGVMAPELGEEFSQNLGPMIPTSAAATLPALNTPAAAAPMAATAAPLQAPANAMNKVVEQMEPMTDAEVAEFTQTMAKNNAQMYARAPKAQMAAAPAIAATAPAATSAAGGASEGAQMTAEALAQALGLSSAGQNSESSEDGSQEEGADSSMLSQTLNADRNIQAPKSDIKFNLAPLEGQQAPQQMSVPDLISNARIMVREGGGEMKVTLTPEGLGEVNMKVTVENGRVNVEMITESDTAKKMIEKGLVDLKSNLHANNLSLDSIKVDTASNLGKQLEQQYQDAQRQQAQNFLQNFRNNDQGWRRENFVTPSAMAMKSQSQAGVSSTTPYPPSKRGPSARRLDLVA